ncbi:MAG: ankyrin repeat domain-containing protein [Fuerstiella sp.]
MKTARLSLTSISKRAATTIVVTLVFCGVTGATDKARNAAATSLASFAEHQNWAALKTALQKNNVDTNSTQADGMTALLWAVYYDQAELVDLLLQQKADANLANDYGVTPLSVAARNGNSQITKALLAANADANASSNGKETVLMTASRTGNSNVVQQLLAAGAAPNAKEQNGQTALMWAAAEGHLDVVNTLLNADADNDVTLKSGFDAYFLAARAGHSDVVFAFLNHGREINDAMSSERTGGKLPRKNMSALMLALENAHFELVKQLLEAGADPNDTRSGFSPLHALSWVRKPNKGDNPNDDPPPQSVGPIGSLECAALLVAHGADVNLQLKSGRGGRGALNQKAATPFLLAADTADVPFMQQLLKLGADPNIPNIDHCPALLAAAGIGSKAPEEEAGSEPELLKAVQLLLDLGADINHRDDNGETAMHGAAYKNVPKVVELLDQAGADPSIWNQKNEYGWTPLRISRGFRPGNFKPDAATEAAIIAVLRRHKIDVPDTPPNPTNNDAYSKKKKTPSKKKK